jgi:hypothetical protein
VGTFVSGGLEKSLKLENKKIPRKALKAKNRKTRKETKNQLS